MKTWTPFPSLQPLLCSYPMPDSCTLLGLAPAPAFHCVNLLLIVSFTRLTRFTCALPRAGLEPVGTSCGHHSSVGLVLRHPILICVSHVLAAENHVTFTNPSRSPSSVYLHLTSISWLHLPLDSTTWPHLAPVSLPRPRGVI